MNHALKNCEPIMNCVSKTFRPLRYALVTTLCFILLPACATLGPVKSEIERVWPLPPDPPRISYVKSLSTPRDMGKKRSWYLLTTKFLFGEGGGPHMLRPYAITIDKNGWVYVADTGLQVVHVFNQKGKEYQQIFWTDRAGSRLLSPVGVAVDDEGKVYISDSKLNQIFVYRPEKRFWWIRIFKPESVRFRLTRVIGGPERFIRVGGLTFNPKSKLLYAVDAGAHRVTAFNTMGEEVFSFGIHTDPFGF